MTDTPHDPGDLLAVPPEERLDYDEYGADADASEGADTEDDFADLYENPGDVVEVPR